MRLTRSVPKSAASSSISAASSKVSKRAEKANGWPQRAGKVVLQIALTRLSSHYGLIGDDRKMRRERCGLRHWGSADYRPTLDAWGKDDGTSRES